MAPEILSKVPYQGNVVDLFALGVILFIMKAGRPPFFEANVKTDPLYKLLADNRPENFWMAHSQGKEARFFSQDFKDLITLMLHEQPHMRMGIADIVAHPWLSSGGAANPEEIRNDFANRQEVNKQKARENEVLKNKLRNKPAARRDLVLNGKVYIDINEDIAAAGEVPVQNIVRLRAKNFTASKNNTHSFFTTYKPEFILTVLLQKMQEQGQQWEISRVNWKVNLSFERNMNENAVVDNRSSTESCKAYIEILHVVGQEKYCISFNRKAGSSMLFYDKANMYIAQLELFNNTTLDD